MTPEDTRKMLAVLRSAFPEMKVEDSTIPAWQMGMKDLPGNIVRQVISDWINDQEWPPKIAQIRKRTLAAMTQLPSSDDAWRMVQERIRGTYPGLPAPTWDAPQIVQDTVKDVGGMSMIRMSEKPEAMRERFMRAYDHRTDQVIRATQDRLAEGDHRNQLEG